MKPEDRKVAQRYPDPSLDWADDADGLVTQYEPDPEEWPDARKLFYDFLSDNREERMSDDDDRHTVDECGLGAEFGGTFITETRSDT